MRRAGIAAVAGVLAAVGVAGCEPCAGVVDCRTPPRVVLSGTILDRESLGPVHGAKVAVGAAEAQTDRAGRWVLAMPAVAGASVDVEVTAPGSSPYVVHDVAVRPVTVRGDAQELGVWLSSPRINFVLGVRLQGAMLPGVYLEFEPDDGGPAVGASADGGGFAHFRGPARAAGPVTGTLRIPNAPAGATRFDRFGLVADHTLEPARIRDWLDLDPSYRFGGNIIFRGTGVPTPGARFTFLPRGGIPVAVDSIVRVAGAEGFFIFDIPAFGRGAIVGDVRIDPPLGGAAYVYRDFVLDATRPAEAIYLGLFAHGERWDWVVEIRRSGSGAPVPFTPFEFVRSGGLAIAPSDTLRGETNGYGRLKIAAAVNDTGTVLGALRILPPGEPPRDAGSFALRTFAADSQQFAGVRTIPPPP